MGRKDQKQVIKEIFGALSKDLKSVTEIADNIGSHHNTVKKSLDLIEFIQGQPKIVIEKTKASVLARLEKTE